MKITVTIASLLLAALAFGGSHAPLPPELMAARTVYIENNSEYAAVAERCYDELTKWGRFQIVNDPKAADLIFSAWGSRTDL